MLVQYLGVLGAFTTRIDLDCQTNIITIFIWADCGFAVIILIVSDVDHFFNFPL